MKHILSTTFILFFFVCLKAQPVLTAGANIPKPGDSYNIFWCDSLAVQGSAGANQTWNFNTLTIDSIAGVAKYVDADATPYLADYPGANLVSVVNLNGTTLYDYFKTGSSSWEELGAEDSLTKEISTVPAIQRKYPFTYNTIERDTFSGAGTGFDTITSYGTSIQTGDGYGTLLLRGVTYTNVLRVKAILFEYDSIQNFFSETINDTSYTWYDTQHYYPLLTIEYSSASIFGFSFSDKFVVSNDLATTTGINAPSIIGVPVSLYPNPSSGNMNVAYNLQRDADVSISVINMLGENIGNLSENNQTAGQHSYMFNNLSAGIYFVKLQAGQAVSTQKFVVVK